MAAQAVNLSPPCDPALYPVAPVVAVDGRAEVADEVRPLRPRPDEAHLALQDVEELRELVDRRAAKELTDGRPAIRFALHTPGGSIRREFDDLARAKSLRVAAAYGGITIREQSSGVTKADILVATPGRLEDLANRRMVKLEDVR